MRAPLNLTARGWAFLMSAAALGCGAHFVQLRDTWYLVAFLAALVFVGLGSAVALPLVARPRLHLSVSSRLPTVDEDIAVGIHLRVAVGGVVTVTAHLGGSAESIPIKTRRGKSTTATVRWVPRNRGPVRMVVSSLEFREPLGIAVRRLRVRESEELLVLPAELGGLKEVAWGSGSEDNQANLNGMGVPGGAVRDYQAGDPQRQVHWKQSARQGSLLVNLHEDDAVQTENLHLVTDAAAYASSEDFETAVRAAATIGCEWLRCGVQVRLTVGSSTPQLFTEEESLLVVLALVQPSGDATPSLDRGVVVTGVHPPDSLASRPGGTVVAVGHVTVPAGWELVVVEGGASD
jgi:uncharacterized protein (DUF58 family)